ncbi:hypothetical protein [Engelhardtia mirabilis]|uniref:Uncharacterized protein n=1 Tax=Engelhardtia mirabilis TaxID=2528011 RepID=A0A518BM52_9BACT|nr:hypothetical protein Pla133_31420 [Planctomycetes bacterium Pla133]QDV02376.1 hypothetical protein Pla86_31410 [Planctomycetes bacterium Pla86]
MKTDRGALPIELRHWLEQATHGLSDEARQRVGREIEDHFRSALEAASAEGLDPSLARRRALDALGDPAAAARDFRRTNLTRFQSRLLEGHCGRPRWPVLALHLGLVALGVWLTAALSGPEGPSLVAKVSVVSMAVAAAVIHLVAPWLFDRGRKGLAVLSSGLAQWLLFASLCVGVPRGLDVPPQPLAAWFYAAVLLVLLVLYLPAVSKARHLGPEQAGP